MLIDAGLYLQTIEKIENKKAKCDIPALMWGGVETLKAIFRECAGRSLTLADLVQITALDGEGAANYALLALAESASRSIEHEGVTERKGGKLSGTQVVEGDVLASGSLTITGSTLITGSLEAAAVDISETGVLVVGGKLSARVVSGDGWLWVRKDINVDVALGYYEAGEFRVGGDLNATLAIMSNHGSYIEENKAKHWFDFEDVEEDDDDYVALERLLDPKTLVAEPGDFDIGVHRVDFEKLIRLATAGKPFLAKKKPSTATKKAVSTKKR